MIYNLYKGKDASQLAFLESALTSKQIKNWRYIKDETTQGCILLGYNTKVSKIIFKSKWIRK